MRIRHAVLAIVVAGAFQTPLSPPAAAAGPVDQLAISGGDDVTLDGTPNAYWQDQAGLTYDVDVARAGDRDSALGDWQPAVTDGAVDGSFATTVARGRVLCVRVRVHTATDDAPWSDDCVVRPHNDADFVVKGARQVVRTAGSGGQATRLLRDGRLLVPGLTAGDRVAAVYSSGRWGDHDGARWRRPDGTESVVAKGFGWESTLAYEVPSSGTGRFFASPGLGTRPITGVAVIPSWLTPGAAEYPTHTGGRLGIDNPPTPNGGTYRNVTPNGSVQFHWNASEFANVSPRLQLATGPALGSRPDWRERPVPQYAGALRVRVPQGAATCARLRWMRSDGLTSAWSRAWCAVRPLDDARAAYRGGFRAAADPASADGRSRRMGRGASYRIAHLSAGALFGFLYYDEPTRADGRVVIAPDIGLDGRAAGTKTGFGGIAPTPSAWWVTVRRNGTVGTVVMPRNVGNRVVRISGVLVFPRWAG